MAKHPAISFLGCYKQTNINMGAYDDRKLYSHSSGGQKSEIKVWAGPCLLQEL